ncbi:nodulation protein NfeD [Rhodoferax sp.]|uniref:NfeD family protein n=1 Tax=Rhodoferax sp. TaxID=50421 RepID=UPI0027328F30|nr:nodulation protein NfeD [Rhodoferax sp.]MDP3193325.1 nodulation protein NfeD [Rhodoferax sp.]
MQTDSKPKISGPGQRLANRALRWWLLALALCWSALAAQAAPVPVLTVHDAIGPASADYIIRGLERAQQQGAPVVVIELDTPGGLDTSMRQIIRAILASTVPVATYVSPSGSRAASAGTYILYASHIAAMAPATTLGAATPVAIGLPGLPQTPKPAPAEGVPSKPASAPADPPPTAPASPMTAKQVNDAAAFIRGLADQRGRNAVWAERAVREAVSLTAAEALQQNVIDLVATDIADLLTQIDGRKVRLAGGELQLGTRGLRTEALPPDWRHRLLSVIANPSFALILLMIGVYGLMFEFSSPGFGVPGTVGAICLLLALFALQLLPVNYAALALILLGFALLAAELVTPAFGVLGIGGVVAFVAGGLLLFDRDVPGLGVPGLGVPLPLIFGLALTAAAAVILGGGMALRARRAPVVSGAEQLIGARGEVTQVTDGQTWARIHGEHWQVRATAPLQPGQRVRVVGMTDLILQVQPEGERHDV